jgi:glucosyl-dolichyl phosphate glucuronosyltransferase
MDISIIVCTYNRCKLLRRALTSAMAMTVSGTTVWEILVVDNNSQDQTREVASDFCDRYPDRVRYLFEPTPGKSHALNAGIGAARGDVVAFMDDDVTVEPTWLESLTAALHDRQYAGSGGRVLPEWSTSPPSWLPDKEGCGLAPLAYFDQGPDAGELTEPPFGTNMAFRKSIFEEYGGFRTDLGPCPGALIRNEDTEFGSRLMSAGERLYYEPLAVVYHPVEEFRIRKEYFLSWWFDKGRSDIRQFGIRPNRKYFVLGLPLYLLRNLAMNTLRWITTMDVSQRFERKLKVWEKAGEIVECYRQSLGAKFCSAAPPP